jgi:peroxiredoxin Q/BCP
LLSDPSRKVAQSYGLVDSPNGYPKRWTIYIGKDGKIVHIDKSVKTGSHGADVAAKLKELGIAERK